MVTYMPVERSLMISDLRAQVAEVVFIKADGNVRLMNCTLNPNYLPEGTDIDHATGNDPTDILTVWDIDVKDWRRIPLNRVITIQAVNR